MSVLVRIPIRTMSEANRRDHWAAKAKRTSRQRGAVRLVLQARCKEPALPCVVTLTRIAPRALDDDNLRGALKAVRDGVADWLEVDDRDARVEWRYAQQWGKAREYAVRIEIIARAEADAEHEARRWCAEWDAVLG